MNCISTWYFEGTWFPAPPCCHNKFIKSYTSDNDSCGPISCVGVSRWGTTWGDKNRSQIMFWAFISSFISFILLFVALSSLSVDVRTVKGSYWTIGQFKYTSDKYLRKNVNVTESHSTFYMGLKIIGIDCVGSNCGSKNYYELDDSNCPYEFCASCAASAIIMKNTVYSSLFTLIPQIVINLGRSKASGDFNFLKWIGMFLTMLGILASLTTLGTYLDGCYNSIPSSISGNEIQFSLGPAFWCTFVAILFKSFTTAANILVPVPLPGFGWDPERKYAIVSQPSDDEKLNIEFGNGEDDYINDTNETSIMLTKK